MCKSGFNLRQKRALFVILNGARRPLMQRSRWNMLSYLSVLQVTVFRDSDMQFTAQIRQTIRCSFAGPSAFWAGARSHSWLVSDLTRRIKMADKSKQKWIMCWWKICCRWWSEYRAAWTACWYFESFTARVANLFVFVCAWLFVFFGLFCEDINESHPICVWKQLQRLAGVMKQIYCSCYFTLHKEVF